jgi:hypothetical protein
MRRLRTTRLLLLLALGVGLLPTPVAVAAGCKVTYGNFSSASTCKDELAWIYDPASRTFHYGVIAPPKTKGKAKVEDPYEYKDDFACDDNLTRPGKADSCTKSSNCPPKRNPDGTPMGATRIQAFRKLKADPNDPWRRVDNGVCMYSGKTVPMSDVLAVGQLIERQLGRPKIVAQPPGGVTLVSFTSLFYAPVQNDATLKIDNPVSGLITATPHYTWDLGDGITAEGAGHPYTELMDQKSPDSDGYYVKAFYRTRGVKNVHLTLTWEVSIKLDGFGVVPMAPIVFKADATTTAKTSHARLVGP